MRSPEQLMMRSPDPINWTVPLDTGKTFQVTQCVRDTGEAQETNASKLCDHLSSVSHKTLSNNHQQKDIKLEMSEE